jgi:hypothetical protein
MQLSLGVVGFESELVVGEVVSINDLGWENIGLSVRLGSIPLVGWPRLAAIPGNDPWRFDSEGNGFSGFPDHVLEVTRVTLVPVIGLDIALDTSLDCA